MPRSPLTIAAIALIGAAAPALAQMPNRGDRPPTPMHGMDRPQMMMPKIGDPALPTDQFLREAAQSDEFERQEGRLAQKMAHDPRLRSFGARMVHDHSQSTAQIQAAVRRAGLRVPPPPPLKPEQRRMIESTRGMASMGGFDADYVNDQVMAHRAALALMTNYARDGQSPPIRQAAGRIVPVIRNHLRMIEDIQRSMPKGHMGNMGHHGRM